MNAPKRARRVRLDSELVAQGLFANRDAAMRAVLAGMVSSEGKRLDHPGELVRQGIALHVKSSKKYVSRGGLKLEGALRSFGLDPQGLHCIDIGCSTGGFTDCLLKAGAHDVCAVDVGRAQFDWRLRNDPRVHLFENTNICDANPHELGAPFDLAVADVSFTSVEHILTAVVALLSHSDGVLCTLVKPQFEARRDEVDEGGIVRDPQVHARVLSSCIETFATTPLGVQSACVSPIHGSKGNIEYFLLARMGMQQKPIDINAVVERAWTVQDMADSGSEQA